jgi:hypothetical protein
MFTLYGTPVKVSAQRQRVMLIAEIEASKEALERFHPESLEAANWRRYLEKLRAREQKLETTAH